MKEPLVVAFGGGVNSAAMLVGFAERGIRPDLILFADTGGEKPETYEFVDRMHAWCLKQWPTDHYLGGIITVRASAKTDPSLEANCLRLGTLPSIVYGGRTCSQRWKLEPCEKFLNAWQPAAEAWGAGLQIRNAKGIDAGEKHRAKDFSDKKTRVEYPLIAWNWHREDCVAAIQRAGLPVPEKSACFFCPSSKKTEVLALAEKHPELFDRAVEMERNAKPKLVNIQGLGRHWSWEDLVAANQNQFKMFSEPAEIPCMCFDGEPS